MNVGGFFNGTKHSLEACKVKCSGAQIYIWDFYWKQMRVQQHLYFWKVSHWEVISIPFFPSLFKEIQNVLKGSGLHISNQRDVNEKVFVTEHKCKISSERFGSIHHVRAILRGGSLLTLFLLFSSKYIRRICNSLIIIQYSAIALYNTCIRDTFLNLYQLAL